MNTDNPTASATSRIDKGMLDNPYLLRRIFEYFIPDNPFIDGQLNKQHLLWAALTSKAFLDPALDTLWSSMVSLIPLLKLLPAFQFVRDTYVLRGVMQERDWDRYWYYARRVREFIYPGESGDDEKLVNHTKVRLAQLWRSPLLPALRRFVCPEVQAPGLFIHTLFLTHTLESVELRFVTEPEDMAVGSVLATMVDETPVLKNLVIWGTLSKQSLSFIPRFDKLQSLDLKQMGSAIDSKFFQQIGTLKLLTTLTIDLLGSLSTDFPVDADSFSSLTALRLTAPYSLMNTILGNLSSKVDLASLAIVAPPAPLAQGWESHLTHLLNKICEHWSSSLTSMTLDQETDWEQAILAMADIAPVLRLSRLTSFRIDRYTMVFSNDDIRQFAAAWGSLEALDLPLDARIAAAGAEPSLSALFTLSGMCPRLKHVQMPIYVKDFSAAAAATARTDSVLEELVVGCHNSPYATTPELLTLARCFDRRFPRVRSIRHMRDVYDMWEKVYVMVVALRSARAEMASLS